MRFVVLLFGFIGCMLTAAAGCVFILFKMALDWLNENDFKEVAAALSSADDNPGLSGLFLLIGAGLGLIGTLLGFFRCGWQGSLLLLIPTIGPAVLNPMLLVPTSLQAFTALISLFVRPLPITPLQVDED